ncbi:MAG: hypothetical protein ACHWZW_02920 [Spirulina sp.]
MLLHVRFQRRYIRSGGRQIAIDARLINQAKRGEVLLPDTLRANIATVLSSSLKQIFPEYAIACLTMRDERIGRGWTQAEVAEKCRRNHYRRNMRDAEISALERGNKFAHQPTRAVLAKVFGMTEYDLFPEFFEPLDQP